MGRMIVEYVIYKKVKEKENRIPDGAASAINNTQIFAETPPLWRPSVSGHDA
jgi:hypothetical protein